MLYAAGYILFCDEGGSRRFLLLRNARHGTWSFPKGHLEPGEDARTAARREVLEETSIEEIEEIPGFEAVLRYRVGPGDGGGPGSSEEKEVRLFLGRCASRSWRRSGEHDAGGWFSPEEVRERLRHDDLRRAFEQALGHLRGGHGPGSG